MIKPEKRKVKLWDPILPDPKIPPYRIPPLCYVPPIWEILLNRDIIETPEFREVVVGQLADDPIPLVRYFEARIELTKNLIKEKKLDRRIGELAINHFQKHLNEIAAIPINIP